MNFKTLEWRDDKVFLIDQRKLPVEEIYVECSDYKQVADAIRTMVVRGAPAIGVAAAMGAALGSLGIDARTYEVFCRKMDKVFETLLDTRPTAVNLRWAIDLMKRLLEGASLLPVPEIQKRLKNEALRIYEEDIATNRRIGEW